MLLFNISVDLWERVAEAHVCISLSTSGVYDEGILFSFFSVWI